MYSWEPPVVKIAPVAGKCTHTVSCFSLLSVKRRLLLRLLWKETLVSWQLTWRQDICSNVSKRCKRCVLRGPSLGVRDPSSVNLAATEKLWSISILRSNEWGWVFSGVLFSSHSDSLTLSFKHPQERFLSCLPANLIVVPALHVTSHFLLQHTLDCYLQTITAPQSFSSQAACTHTKTSIEMLTSNFYISLDSWAKERQCLENMTSFVSLHHFRANPWKRYI